MHGRGRPRTTPGADAQRNRDRVLGVARTASAAGRTPTLEATAREAGVGIGPLYRHYPTREALIEAVYRTEPAEGSVRHRSLCARRHPVGFGVVAGPRSRRVLGQGFQ
ncbi:TetR/AcrR family transcriptional regulator [Streptomyces sp. WAC05858]|nr:TetR/AcrR family transcriptional regulator [Streptomyces sp. WAC05858]